MTNSDDKEIGERQVRALVASLATAIRDKNVEALMSHYAPDVLAFDLLPPLQYSGADALRKRVSAWFASFEGSISFEMRNLNISAGENIAFCYSLNGVSGTSKDGAKVEMWWRATNCIRKIDGAWLVTHGHSSEPFDMETGKALLDLKS